MRFTIENAAILTDDAVLEGGSVVVNGGLIESVHPAGEGDDATGERIDLGGRRLVPGFVDIQVNGGGGVLFNNAPTVDGLERISNAHLQFGTTSMLPTLITDEFSVMEGAIDAVRAAKDRSLGGIIGIHLEGPFLNPTRKGAHDESKMRVIDDEAVELLTSLGSDLVTLVTLAPEKTSTARIRALAEAGVRVFAGHTAATFEQCIAAEQAGLCGYTHLFNAMSPFNSRKPGVVGAAVESKNAVFSIIADGHHVHPASFAVMCRAKFRGGAILVTDAMPTVGSEEPRFELNGEHIELCNGVLRNVAGSLAGSNLTMIDAVRNAIEFSGIEWQEAVRMASTYPARAIGREKRVGSIRESARADLIELTENFRIARVWRAGTVVHFGQK